MASTGAETTETTEAAETTCTICISDMGVPAYQPSAKDLDSDGSSDERDSRVKAVGGRKATHTLRCGHTFHVSCIMKQLRHDNRCPICRQREEQPVSEDSAAAGGAGRVARAPQAPRGRGHGIVTQTQAHALMATLQAHQAHLWGLDDGDGDGDSGSGSDDDMTGMHHFGDLDAVENNIREEGRRYYQHAMPRTAPHAVPTEAPAVQGGARVVGPVTMQNRDGTFVTRGGAVTYAPAPAPTPVARPHVAPPPIPVTPTITAILDGTAPRTVVPAIGGTQAVDLILPIVAAFQRARGRTAPAVRRLDLLVSAGIHSMLDRAAPQACRVEWFDEPERAPSHIATAVVHYAKGDPCNPFCTWYYTRAEGWRLALDDLLLPNEEYRLLVGRYTDAPFLSIRAMAPYADGEAMVADLERRIAAMGAMEATEATEAVAGAGLAVPDALSRDTGAVFVPSLTDPDLHLRLLPAFSIPPPRAGEHGTRMLLEHLRHPSRTRWACGYVSTVGTDIALLREGARLTVAVTVHTREGHSREERQVDWTAEVCQLMQVFLGDEGYSALIPVAPIPVAPLAEAPLAAAPPAEALVVPPTEAPVVPPTEAPAPETAHVPSANDRRLACLAATRLRMASASLASLATPDALAPDSKGSV